MLSQKYKCVFVHIPKTAGQSIEQVFLRLHGLDWQSRSALLLRPNIDPKLGPPRLAHLRAMDYVRCGYLSREQFLGYFSFAVIRNPWDRMVSLYRYLGFGHRCTFNFFVQHVFHRYIVGPLNWFVGPQCAFVCDHQERLLVNHLIYFEKLSEGFMQVCDLLEIERLKLPHLNSSGSIRGGTMAPELANYVANIPIDNADHKEENHGRYQDYYDHDSRAIVSEYYAIDISMFNYEFI